METFDRVALEGGPPSESFFRGAVHGLTLRVPGLDVACDKSTALRLLAGAHRAAIAGFGLDPRQLVTGDQVHGRAVAVFARSRPDDRILDEALCGRPVPETDALVTDREGLVLGVYVADCAPVYFYDPDVPAIGLAHSGRKGSELAVAAATIEAMCSTLGSRPENIRALIGPCIRPPHYEVDFPASIAQQCRVAGLVQVADSGICTACNPERYYSYRAEKGCTGRMLAFLALRVHSGNSLANS